MPTQEKKQMLFQTVEPEKPVNKFNNVLANFIRRGESYKEGMLLLIDFLTEQDWKLGDKFEGRLNLVKENVKTHYKHYLDALTMLGETITFEEAEKQFADLLGSYQILLDRYTTLQNRNTLLIAERCAVLLKGRESFSTPTKLRLDPVLSVDQQEIPYTDEEFLFKEYAKIASQEPPFWFQRLAPWQQEFIKANWRILCKKSIPSSLRWLPGLANLSLHRFSINDQEHITYFRHATQLPIDLTLQNGSDVREEAKRLTELNLASQIRLSLQHQLQQGVVDTQKPYEVVILMQSLLSPGAAATLRSQHFSDASDNDTLIYEMKEAAVARFQEALEKPLESEHKALLEQCESLTINEADGSLAYKGQPIKISLLSTNRPYNVLRRFGSYVEQSQRNGVNVARLLGAVARYLEVYALPERAKQQSGYRSEQVSQLLEDLEEAWQRKLIAQLVGNLAACEANKKVSADARKQLIENIDNLKASGKKLPSNTFRLLDALQAFLSIPPGQGALESDKRHRQSLASALEVVIVHCIGGTPWLACKSGKDRTGVASAAVDAAETFYQRYQKYPRYEDTEADRMLYLQILDELLKSVHHQKVAAQNAPGAEGLVNRQTCLPDDMELDEQSIRLETKLARLNKPKIKVKTQTEVVNQKVFDRALQEIKAEVMVEKTGNLLEDWRRNWQRICIKGVNVRKLRKGKRFENEEDVIAFIAANLLSEIEDKYLRKYYREQIPYIFHQGAFLNAFGHLCFELTNQLDKSEEGYSIIFPASDFQINFLPLKEGVKIEEINMCGEVSKAKDSSDRPDYDTKRAKEEGCSYYYQTYSCISIKSQKNKKGEPEFFTEIDAVSVDCAGEGELLRPLFFVKLPSLFEVLIKFFMAIYALCESLKHKWQPAKEVVEIGTRNLVSTPTSISESREDTLKNMKVVCTSISPCPNQTRFSTMMELLIVDVFWKKVIEVVTKVFSPRTDLLLTINRGFWSRPQPPAIKGCVVPTVIENEQLVLCNG